MNKPARRRWPLEILSRVVTWFAVTLIAFGLLVAIHFTGRTSSVKWWGDAFSILMNLFVSGLVSFLFYFLVVHLPANRRKTIIKTNLLRMYRGIKRDILYAVVHASMKGGRTDLSADSETIDELMSVKGFRQAFENGREADEGFYAFENQMTSETPEFRQIVLNLQMLSKQIDYLLQNYSIDDQHAFDFFKRLQLLLIDLQEKGPGYDEAKPLGRFIWEVYAGWNFIEGDVDGDQIQKMIGSL